MDVPGEHGVDPETHEDRELPQLQHHSEGISPWAGGSTARESVLGRAAVGARGKAVPLSLKLQHRKRRHHSLGMVAALHAKASVLGHGDSRSARKVIRLWEWWQQHHIHANAQVIRQGGSRSARYGCVSTCSMKAASVRCTSFDVSVNRPRAELSPEALVEQGRRRSIHERSPDEIWWSGRSRSTRRRSMRSMWSSKGQQEEEEQAEQQEGEIRWRSRSTRSRKSRISKEQQEQQGSQEG